MFETYLEFDWGRDILNRASDTLEVDLMRIGQEDPDNQLNLMPYSSATIYTGSLLEFELWKQFYGTKIEDFSYIVGMSLGEYIGAAAAESISFEDGLKLVWMRGWEMMKCVENAETLTASLKAGKNRVLELIDEEPHVEIALLNSPVQTVISGKKKNIENVLKLAKRQKIRGIALKVSVPTHNSMMQPASIPVKKFLNAIDIQPAKIPILSNPDAEPYTSPEELRASLTNNLYCRALFYPCVKHVMDNGANAYVEGNEKKVTLRIVEGILKYKEALDKVVLE